MLTQAKLNRNVFFWILYQFALGMLLSPFVICFPLCVSHYLVPAGQDPKAILFIIWALSNIFSTLVTPYFGLYLDEKHTHRFWLIFFDDLNCYFISIVASGVSESSLFIRLYDHYCYAQYGWSLFACSIECGDVGYYS